MEEYESRWAREDADSKRRENLWDVCWPGHIQKTANTELERSLQDSPEEWQCLRVETDPEADYSYDDLALMKHRDGTYLLLRTSGCSCPSPNETWGEVCSGTRERCFDHVAAEVKSQTKYQYRVGGPYRGMLAWMSKTFIDEEIW